MGVPEIEAMTREQRIALARTCLDRMAAGEAAGEAIEESVDENGDLVRAGRAASGRGFRVIARISDDEEREADLGDVDLVVEVDNRLGYLELVHWPGEEGLPPYHARIAPELHASSVDPDTREWMRGAAERIGEDFTRRVVAFFREFEGVGLEVGAAAITVSMIADLTWDEDEWREDAPDVKAQVDALDPIAALVERVLPEAFVTCSHCGGRFDAAAAVRCPHCGAPL